MKVTADRARSARTGERFAYLDNLRVGLIAGIIAAHAINSYTEFGSAMAGIMSYHRIG